MSVASKVLVVQEHTKLKKVIHKFTVKAKPIFGFACIVDGNNVLKGVFNAGDLLRSLDSSSSLDIPISDVMTKAPVALFESDIDDKTALGKIESQLRSRFGEAKKSTHYIPIVDQFFRLIDIYEYDQLVRLASVGNWKVSIWGLGFVGITLLAAIAARNISVIGIDKSKNLVSSLLDGDLHVHEPGLSESLAISQKNSFVDFSSESIKASSSNVHIICVGTPINSGLELNAEALKAVASSISKIISVGDLILVRSTVPIGTTRNLILPILERSGLIGGQDFSLAFSPERTVEGNALAEITTIPQIIGGLTETCLENAESFWQSIASSIVPTESLEAAEMVKLLNNSYRDLTFSFSNAFISIAHKYNVEANNVIKSANAGYIRGNIPMASPGVGGYCLTKDPFIYCLSDPNSMSSKLSKLARNINHDAAIYPIKQLSAYTSAKNLSLKDLHVFIIGMAFKGNPPTNDLRGSSSVEVYEQLEPQVASIACYDHVLANDQFSHGLKFNFKPLEYSSNADIVLILNNHPDNSRSGLLKFLDSNKSLFFFDGWNQFQKLQIEKNSLWTYSTLGYMTSVLD